MSERATETVVVRDANDAHALIGRRIDDKQVTAICCSGGGVTLKSCGEFVRTLLWDQAVVVDALPPATEKVHLDDVKDRKLPGETEPVYGVGTREGEWQWWPTGGGERRPLSVVDHMVEVLAETPPTPEPDTVSVRGAAEALIQTYSPLDFTEPRIEKVWADLVAALAAEGDER